jgi:hypothetical protein
MMTTRPRLPSMGTFISITSRFPSGLRRILKSSVFVVPGILASADACE